MCKIGMPLVFLYHALLGNIFLNTAAEEATGLEKAANVLLIPSQYLFEGKKAVLRTSFDAGTSPYLFENRFSYKKEGFFIKNAVATTLAPLSLAGGSVLKGLSYLFPETRNRAKKIAESLYSTEVISNEPYYKKIGIDCGNWKHEEILFSPRYKRKEVKTHQLQQDLIALQEILAILEKRGLFCWIDCGSCLGAYQYGGVIPLDWDIDIGFLAVDFENIKHALHELDPQKWVVQDWSARNRPGTYLKVYVKETGGLIDLYAFRIDADRKEVASIFSSEETIFMPEGWKIREKRTTVPCSFSDVFPLKKAMFEGIEVPVPAQIEKYLSRLYGENLAPAKIFNEITQQYEKDPTHPYWQIPHAH